MARLDRSLHFPRFFGTLLAVCLGSVPALFAAEAHLHLDAEAAVERLPLRWIFSPADDPSNANLDTNADEWGLVDTRLLPQTMPSRWTGIGWFKLRLTVDPALVGRPLALLLDQSGASEVYLDGALLAREGTVGHSAAATRAYRPVTGRTFVLDSSGPHILAIRYAQHHARAYHRVGWPAGFWGRIGTADSVVAANHERTRTVALFLGLFAAVFLSFTLLHLLLFSFYPERPENLDFAGLAAMAGVLVILLFVKPLVSDPRFLLFSEPGMACAGLLFVVFVVRFVHGVFTPRRPRWLRALLLGGLFAGAISAVWTAALLTTVFLVMLLGMLETIRVTAVAVWQRHAGARTIGAGLLALATGFTIGLLSNLGVLPKTSVLATLVPFSSMVVLVVLMSAHLSHSFAATNRELRRRLDEVERLSAEKLEQELERQRLVDEVAHTAKELAEARELQLSMLPKDIPQLPQLEIAARMVTATEVGGDYYDFEFDNDGVLTAVVGDATGHGMRAGTMVAAAKSLFNAIGHGENLPQTLGQFSRALKKMRFRKLSMALTLVRVTGDVVAIAAAAMPPAIVYRAVTGDLKEVALPGLPLGTFSGAHYRSATITLEPGDTILLMSDGFPERLDPSGEPLGYERAVQAFHEAVHDPPDTIVDRLLTAGDRWGAGRANDDDVTFVVLKRRSEIDP